MRGGGLKERLRNKLLLLRRGEGLFERGELNRGFPVFI